MNANKNDKGTLSPIQLNNRYLNILQLTYLSSNKDPKSKGFHIPEKVMNMIETELDFNSTETTKKGIIEQYKQKYRKRKSYLMWSEILRKGHYKTYNDAKDVLIMVHETQSYRYQSITQERYALETLELALDDYFGTSKVKITPNKYITKSPKARKSNKLKPNKKASPISCLNNAPF
jgi:hypothetical protein